LILHGEWGNIVPVAARLGVLLMAAFGAYMILIVYMFTRRGK